MRTIRRQLLLWLLGGVLACTLAAGFAMYLKVREETSELFDYQLREIAASLPPDFSAAQPEPGEHDPEQDVVVQVWDGSGARVYASHPAIALPRLAQDGFSTVRRGETEWRVFGQTRQGRFVQVAQDLSARNELVFGVAARSLAPFLALIPVLALLIGLVVGRSLAPLQRVARAVGHRSAEALQPLSTEGIPPEILPMLTALNDLLDRLGHALEAQRAFVADAAHELRTPLTALKLQLQLAERAEPGPAQAAAFARLHQRLDRAAHLVEQLLALARQEPPLDEGAREAVDLAQLAREVVADYDDLAESRGVDLGVEVESDASVRGQRDGLRTMLGNLVDNALRYTPGGGRADVIVATEAQHAVLRVVDTGPGIPPDGRERVFDRFHRGEDPAAPGTGLGLAIVKRVVERHRAAVRLDDGPGGRGLEVRVTFAAWRPATKL
jgi:two-component system, OmpR family, sensor kinase